MDFESSTHFSHSRLETHKECPRRYLHRYVRKDKRERRTAETFLGGCVHRALEELYGQLQHGRVMPQAEVLKAFAGHWEEGWADAIEIHDKRISPKEFKGVGEECLRTYYEAHAPFDDGRAHEVEKKLSLPLAVDVDGEAGEYVIDGFIDRLSFPRGEPDLIEIHDYKTGAHLPTQPEVDGLSQFDVYDLLVRARYPGVKRVGVFLHFLRFGRTLRPSRDPSADRTGKTLEFLASCIKDVKRDRVWEPRFSHLCDWCEYRDVCPRWAHGEKVKTLTHEARLKDGGVRLVDELAALEEKKKKLKEELKDLDREEAEVRDALLEFASELGVSAVSGTAGEAVISEKEECKFPTKTHSPEKLEELEGILKEMSIWKDVSHVDPHLLLQGLRERRWDPGALQAVSALIESFVHFVKEKHLRLRRKKGEAEPD